MASSAPQTASLDIGRVLGRGFETLGSQFVTFILLGLVLVGIPSVLLQLLLPTQTTDPNQALAVFTNPIFWLTLLVNLLLAFLLQAALTRAAILHIKGESVQVGDLLVHSMRLLLPLIGLTIVMTLGIMLGAVLLIVPGIILATMWIVAVPVLVEERPGVFGSLSRSAELTKGYRWWVFLLFVIYVVATGIVGGIAAVLGVATLGEPTFALIIASVILSLALTLVSVSVLASLYIELKVLKYGDVAGSLEAIFA